MEPMVWNQVKHLYEVEKLSIRQIAQKLRMARKTVARVVRNEQVMRSYPDSILRPYERLMDQWYQEYPFLRPLRSTRGSKVMDLKAVTAPSPSGPGSIVRRRDRLTMS